MISSVAAKNSIWVCSGLSIVILFIRLWITRRSPNVTLLGRILTVTSILVVTLRLANDYYLLKFGTANDALNGEHYFNHSDQNRIKAGSILALMARLFDTTYFWLQTSILLLFYTRVLGHIDWVSRAIKLTWLFLGLSYIAVILATFLECRPFHRYWQVQPRPGQCIRAWLQLFLQGACNIVLDIMLLIIAMPIFDCRRRTWTQNLRVGTLVIIGTFCIIVTAFKFVYIHSSHSAQPSRSLLASVQMVVSAFVANAPTIYGCLRLQQRLKQDQISRRGSRPENSTSSSLRRLHERIRLSFIEGDEQRCETSETTEVAGTQEEMFKFEFPQSGHAQHREFVPPV